MTVGRRMLRAAVAACLAAMGGCDRSPAAPPGNGFDPVKVESALATVNSVLGTPTMQSLTALSPRLIVAAAPPAASSSDLNIACGAPASRAPMVAGAAALRASSLIADSLFRHVIVYDTLARGYRISADTGGPAGGIRFMLYTVNGYALPSVPLTPDGWLDLADQGAGAAPQLRSQISNGTSGIADYLVGLSGTRVADAAVLSGTVTDGTHTLRFRDSTTSAPVAGTVAVRVVVSAHVSDSLDGFSLDMLASRTTFDPFDYEDTLDFTLMSGSQTLRLVGTITTYCLFPSVDLTVAVNGTAYATVTNATPNVTLVGGRPATTDEAQAVLDLQDGQRRLLVWLSALFAPAKALLP